MKREQVKITVLVDYAASEGLDTEHGFAAWVEVGEHAILFDEKIALFFPRRAGVQMLFSKEP